MSLSRGDYVQADIDKRLFEFTMLEGDDIVRCTASWEFVDGLDHHRPRQWVTREDQFSLLRNVIEERILRKYAVRPSPGVDLRTNDLKLN